MNSWRFSIRRRSYPRSSLAEFQQEFLAKTQQAVAKRSAVIRAIRHIENQIELARAEENRLAAWRASLSSGLDRFKDYVIKCIELSGQKKVEADNGSLSIQANPESVDITDIEALPDEFKSVTVKMPAAFFREVVEGYVDGQAISATFTPDKAAIRTALKEGREVPGADSRFGRLRLVVR